MTIFDQHFVQLLLAFRSACSTKAVEEVTDGLVGGALVDSLQRSMLVCRGRQGAGG